jgi:hypothetical protein
MLRVDQLRHSHPQPNINIQNRKAEQTFGDHKSNFVLDAVVTVPVVVHIVLPYPYQISDADVQAQIDRLNLDFAGMNADSSNASAPFLAVRGHSRIQFCLAKRTPSGELTSGIERRASSIGSLPLRMEDPIKFADQGGLDPWDPELYLNLWVGKDASNNGVLGYAQFPGTMPANQDGVFINVDSWGSSSCYTIPDYNIGRTATHEIGHYFGLLHTWGDDNGDCSGDDFRDLSEVGSTCILPEGMYNPAGQGNTAADIGDTPNQAGETSSCPSGEYTDACAGTTPGTMYQNQMDYSFDACLTMFTKKQVERMEWILANCRASLQTSMACQPPLTAPANDIAVVESVNPGGYEVINCGIKTYPSAILCAGSIEPKFRIVNKGSQPLTSVRAGYIIDGAAAVTQTFSLNLLSGATAVLSFSAAEITPGIHQITYFTTLPNGASDGVPANDSVKQTFTVNGNATTPLIEMFKNNTFPPQGWSVLNPDNDVTWQRFPDGNVTPGSAYINTFNYSANQQWDDLISPNISYPPSDSLTLTFELASATYTDIDDPINTGTVLDTLEVLVTQDCGNTFTPVYKKSGQDLRTETVPQEEEFFPTASQWRKERVDLTQFMNGGSLQLVFRMISNFENNSFIDNVNVTATNVPPLLKEQGYLLLPNPFQQKFAVWHYQQPVSLHHIRVYNSAGQLVLQKSFNGNAEKYISLDMPGSPAGIYIVQLEYANPAKTISQRVVKY